MAGEIDVLGHELVPKHEVLSEEEKKEVLERYKVSQFQLPKILVSDPAARAIGAKVGDVIKITRESPTAGKAIAYRCVVEG
jgi:DNA-directed RNA polymerase subunit H